jgi:hypothetical protein
MLAMYPQIARIIYNLLTNNNVSANQGTVLLDSRPKKHLGIKAPNPVLIDINPTVAPPN